MDIITELPKASKKNDATMVEVYKFIKETHFIVSMFTHKPIDVTHIFMKEIFKLHAEAKNIISYQDDKFTSNI